MAAAAYDRFMGRYAAPLAPLFADLAGVAPGQRVLDVGCGPGALTGVLVERLGEARVCATDPSPPFVAATRERFPGLEVRTGAAEELPWADDVFDAALAQLVVSFMADPVRGLSEMARVTAPGGLVAVCVWDHAGSRGPLSPFWRAAGRVAPVRGEGDLPGATGGDLARLLGEAGLVDVAETELGFTVQHDTFEEWWEPYTMGVGPAGDAVAELSEEQRRAVRDACRADLDPGPVTIAATAWAATGRVPAR